MSGRAIPPETKQKFETLREMGYSVKSAASEVGISQNTGENWARKQKYGLLVPRNGPETTLRDIDAKLPPPKPAKLLPHLAKKSMDDFAFWRERYLGRRSTPWQEEAAYSVVAWLDSPDTEFIVVNCPPGSGKSTLFTHDIPAWMICRDRSIRILLGSRTARLAGQYSNRIRRLLERPRPVQANPKQGRPNPAKGCLAVDFGRFRPAVSDIWRQMEFTVASDTEEPLEDKEPTVSAFGMDSEFLGARANLVIWDDLVVGSVLKTMESIENQRKWWDEEGETRVEPSGALILQGQRMGPEDLYRYALDQKRGVDYGSELSDEEVAAQEEAAEPRYRHIIFPAHFEDRCQKDHGRDALAYPEGCLLDPHRLPWRGGANDLLTIQRNRSEKYRVQYQQEDVDPANVLVEMAWIKGGKDSEGEDAPGCLDRYRDLRELPKGLSSPWYSIATADPSPTRYWSIQWWIYHPGSQQRFLMDHVRQVMDAPDFLDWNDLGGVFSGLMEDWQNGSREIGYPISTWIVENNAAQRFMLQYEHVKRWQRKHGVAIVPHSTGRNKLDADYGVQMLANKYRYGQIRLPDKAGAAHLASLKLIDEVTRYPDSSTDDCVMAQWFFEFHLPTLSKPKHTAQRLSRPSFMRGVSSNPALLVGGRR